MARESEIKIPVSDLDSIRRRLAEERARRVREPHRERNSIYDTVDNRLNSAGRTLRSRSSGERHLLTLKGPATYVSAVKIREEIEVEVADSRRVEQILTALGYSVVIRYEKDREEWRLGDVLICLDHTPMGDFVEIEGPPERLVPTASAIGLDAGNAVEASYLGLWSQYRRDRPELRLPHDMVFTR